MVFIEWKNTIAQCYKVSYGIDPNMQIFSN